MSRKVASIVVLGWALLYARGNGWQVLESLPSSYTCEQLRVARIDQDIQHEIGSALASQSGDNPMRVQAYQAAAAHVNGRYRCAEVQVTR
jgi:hypothetical protein